MPELPEVENLRQSLAATIAGATIERVELGTFTGCIGFPDPEVFATRVAGTQITAFGRRGKYLLIGLDSGDTITVHLRMTGELTVTTSEAPTHRHHHLTFILGDGRELRYADTRKFGRLQLLEPDELAELDQRLGPEPLDPDLTAARFADMLAKRTRAVKPLLLDQTFLAGVGNIYADEALFAAQVHPLRPANELTATEAERLLTAVRAALSDAIVRGGTTLRDYRDGLGRPGTNQNYLQIYHLADGQPCPRCGGPITRIVVGQRGTRLCPRCQPLPSEALANRPARSHEADRDRPGSIPGNQR